ncbi:MAG TPA: alpha/beta hydrolase [Pseudonocardiaceae bacterium]|jgi:acetyl esterase/lipase
MNYALDPEIAAVIPLLPQSDYQDLAGERSQLKARLTELLADLDTSGVSIHDELVPGSDGAPAVAVRVYRPDVDTASALLLDVHGGGFMLGDLDMNHADNVELARDLGVVVVSVDYRLAPEAPFPAGLEDCYTALTWLVNNAESLRIDPTRVVTYGVSAGAGLCAALALLARDRGGPPISFQYLDSPELDDRLGTHSMRVFTDTPVWNRFNAEISWHHYLGPEMPGSEQVSLYAAPARATDLTGLPPTYISVMEFDPLRDEGIDYARALLAAGVLAELHLFPGTFHSSGLMVRHPRVSQRQRAERHAVLARALGVDQ